LAKIALQNALDKIPNQPDALEVLRQVFLEESAKLEVYGNHSYDAGENDANEWGIDIDLPLNDKHELNFGGWIRSTKQQLSLEKADQRVFNVGDKYQVRNNLSLFGSIGVIESRAENNETLRNISFETGIEYVIKKHYNVGIQYNRDAKNYSSDLIQSGILRSQWKANFLYSKHNWPSLFIQYENNSQTDSNKSEIYFVSLFYQLSAFPLIKTGLNYNSLAYDFSIPELYFSPQSYKTTEAFLHFGNDYNRKSKLIYHLEYTIGRQKIDSDPWVLINRLSTDLGYRFPDKFILTGQYFYSNAANTTNKGFTFNRFQLKLNYII